MLTQYFYCSFGEEVMPFPPEVYLIGSQKSGTTTLSYLLSQHSKICISNPKEVHFFSQHWTKGLTWYQKHFSMNQNLICIDASTSYSMASLTQDHQVETSKNFFDDIPQRLYSINPKAKFIYIMRDPVERTYSGYWHYYTRGQEKRSFLEAIKNDPFYLDLSNYYGQLELWLKYFPIESFLFILFEDFKKYPEKIVKECLRFIDVSSEEIQIDSNIIRNKAIYANRIGRQFNRLFAYLDAHEIHLIPKPIQKFISIRHLIRRLTLDTSITIPKMTEEERAYLQEYFFTKNRNLELLTGLSLNRWQ
jgi:hypothetical protein